MKLPEYIIDKAAFLVYFKQNIQRLFSNIKYE